jgi:phage tail tape-measure protein
MLPPDDLLGLPGDHASLRPGARAAEAGRQCREALLQERPGLSAKAISVRSVSLPPGGADPGILRVDGAFRDNLASQPAVWQFTCDVSPTGRLNLRIAPD